MNENSDLTEWIQRRKAQELPEYITQKPWCDFKEEFIEVGVSKDRMNLISWVPIPSAGYHQQGTQATETAATIVYISHGLHEHILKYTPVAEELTKRGMIVYGADHMGHGLSYGTRGLVKDHKKIISDQIEVINMIRTRHSSPSGIKLFMLCHSMGTLIAMNSITKLECSLSGVCLSGIATVPGPAAASPFGMECLYPLGQSSVGICLASCLSSINEQGPAAPILMEAIVNSWVEREIWKKDPRRFTGDIMNKSAYEVLSMTNSGKKNLPNITCPVLIIHGRDDEICYPVGATETFYTLGTRSEYKEMVIFDGLKHEMFRDDGCEKVIDCMATFFEKYSKEEFSILD